MQYLELFNMLVKVAIFASGSGTNAENIINYFSKSTAIDICLLLSNKADAYVLERAKSLSVPSVVFSREDFYDSDRVLTILKEKGVDFIVLAGFLLKVPHNLVEAYPKRMINIHPALLPKYGGKGMYGKHVHEAVVAAGEAETGITIHYINEHYDDGDIIFQARCSVSPTDTPEDVARKVHQLEYEHYPKQIETIIKKLL